MVNDGEYWHGLQNHEIAKCELNFSRNANCNVTYLRTMNSI